MTPWSMPAKDMIIPYFFYIMAASSILGQDGYRGLRRGTRKLTEPQVVRAAQLMIDLQDYYNEGFQAVSYAEGKALFAQGRTAMLIGGSADYAGYKQVNPKVDVGVFGFPSPSGNRHVTVTGLDLQLLGQLQVEAPGGGDDVRGVALVEGRPADRRQRAGSAHRRSVSRRARPPGRARDGAAGDAGHPCLVLPARDRAARSEPSTSAGGIFTGDLDAAGLRQARPGQHQAESKGIGRRWN